jgi:hypothetical protein
MADQADAAVIVVVVVIVVVEVVIVVVIAVAAAVIVADRSTIMAKLRVKWVKSAIGYSQDQKDTIRALGLRKLQQTVEH